MKAAIMDAPGAMRLGEWDTPSAGPGEVKVQVAATGICAGDLYIYKGSNPYVQYPVIAGHEIAGVVAEAGEGVSGFSPGERVVVEPFIGCGHCYPCRVGKSNCCMNLRIIGVHQPGGFAEWVVAPAKNIYRVPEGLSLMWASFAEPIAIAVQAARRGEIESGEEVLVLGCGPIGLALIEVLQAYGAKVIATDIFPERLETAASLGADTLLSGPNLTREILERTNREGMGVVIEATGNPKVMEQTAELVASGGRIVILGLAKKGETVSFSGLDFTRKEMTIVGSRASVGCFPEALRLLSSGAIRYPEVARELPLEQAPEIFARLTQNPAALHKGVLVIEGSPSAPAAEPKEAA